MIEFKHDELRMKNGVYYTIRKLELLGNRPYHNGYIFLNERKDNGFLEQVIEDSVEVTYNGIFKCNGETYAVLGFDTAHFHNILNPETQTYNAVEKVIYDIFENYNTLFYEERDNEN